MRLRALYSSIFAALALAVFGGADAAVATVPGNALPLTGFSHMLDDGAHHHVFITGASGDSVIVVRNEDGTPAGTITGESGAGGMVLDGSTLYVARCGWGTIDEIDTATLTKVGSFPAAVGGTCDLAEAGGRLWYSDSTDSQFGHLISVSLDSSHTEVNSGIWLYEMVFASSAANPNWLVIGESHQSPTVAYVEDVTDPAHPVQITYKFDLGGGGNLQDLALSPDGEQLLTAAGAPYEIDAFSLPSLSAAGVYPTTNYPNSAAFSADGLKLAGGSDAVYGKDVWLFDAGNSTPIATWDFGGTSDELYPRGLAFSSDSAHLFAVSAGQNGTSVILHVLSTSDLPTGSVTIHASAATVGYGHAVTVTAHLGTAGPNRTLAIYRRPAAGGTWTLVKSGAVNASGNLAVSVKPTANTVYHAVWAGNASHAETTSGTSRVNVRVAMHAPTQGGYANSGGYRLYHYTSACGGASHTGCPTFLTYAAPLHENRTFTITVQAHTSSGWKTVLHGSHTSGSTGKLLVHITYANRGVIGHQQRFNVSMGADSDHLGNTSAWSYFRVTS